MHRGLLLLLLRAAADDRVVPRRRLDTAVPPWLLRGADPEAVTLDVTRALPLEPGGGSRTGDGGDRFERRRPLGNRMVSDRKADSEPHAQRRPRTSRPGRAPVSTPSRRVTSPATIVAR